MEDLSLKKEKIKKVSDDFKIEKNRLKLELKSKLSDKEIFKIEKEILKNNFRNEIGILNLNKKKEIKKIKNPEKFNTEIQQIAHEEKIVNLQNERLDQIDSLTKQIRKAKRKKEYENLPSLKSELKNFKKTSKSDLDLKIKEIEEKEGINKYRKFKNDLKVYGMHVHKKAMPHIGKIANQRHLMAIRNAFSSLIPLIMIASFITIIRSIPTNFDPKNAHAYLSSYFPAKLDNGLVTISNLTMGLMALGLAFGIGVNLGQNYNEAPLISGIMGFIGFILWVGPSDFANSADGQGLPISLLGSKGLFVALIMSIAMFELYRIFKKYRITIVLPKSVPQAVANSFIAIIPAVIYALLVMSIRYVADFDLINEMTNILKPIGSAITDNFGAVILIVLLNSLFWWFGIHGSAITGIITYPFWYPAIAENTEWFNNGMNGNCPNTFVEPYYQWSIWIGGAGSTIGLAIASMFLSKSKQNKALSKATCVPAFFNISEPMMFGYPVVLNVYFFIPFMLAPVGTAIASTVLVKIFSIHWVVYAPWSLPGPIGAFLAAGNDWKAIIVNIASIAVATLIWWPFYKMYDTSILKAENETISKEAEKQGLTVIEFLKKVEREKREEKLKTKTS